jgi:hypothetical protein
LWCRVLAREEGWRRILATTVTKVLRREGINQVGQATAEKFKGSAPSAGH